MQATTSPYSKTKTRTLTTNTTNTTMNTEHKQPHEVIIPTIDESNPVALFEGATLKLAIDAVEREVDALSLDPSNASDYKHFGSFNRKLGSFGAAIDKAGKSIVDPIKAQAKEVDAMRKPTEAEWKAHIALCESAVISEELQGDRCEEFAKLKADAIEMNQRRFAEFVETEKALEAGRVALKAQENAEAAKRHAEREKANAEKESAATTPPVAKETPKPAVTPTTTAKNSVYSALLKYGMGKVDSKEFVNAVEAGKVDYLTLTV